MKHILFLLFTIFVVSGCSQDAKRFSELTEITEKLKLDENHTFLQTLQPDSMDLANIFKPGESLQRALNFSNSNWENVDKIPENTMKPNTEAATIQIDYATKSAIQNGNLNGLPADYRNLVPHLKENITIYGIRYVNADGKTEKIRAAFFYTNGKWIFVPKVFRAFR